VGMVLGQVLPAWMESPPNFQRLNDVHLCHFSRHAPRVVCVLEQTNKVFPIGNVGADYRRSSRGDVCSNRTAISFGLPPPECR
jgi:hypothetical protein